MITVSRPARLTTVPGRPAGIAVVSRRYMRRTIPLHRSEEPGSRAGLPDLACDTSGFADRRQPPDAGAGPLPHRSHAVRIAGSSMTPAALIDLVAARLNQASPETAVFRKTRGARSALRQGGEFIVRMPGPWDGPVRVVRREETSFRLATLDGPWRRARSSSGQSPTATRCASRSSRGPGPATGCQTCSATSCGWPGRSSSTRGRTSASAPPRWPAAAPRAASPSAPAGCPGPRTKVKKSGQDRSIRPAQRDVACTTCRNSRAVVTGPTPPGTGVSAPATAATAGSTSPASVPSLVTLVPTSMTIAPGET
jgi:hypothetical protein